MKAFVRDNGDTASVTIEGSHINRVLLTLNKNNMDILMRVADSFNEEFEEYVQLKAKVERITQMVVIAAHNKITRSKGKEYAPDVHELQAMIDTLIKQNT